MKSSSGDEAQDLGAFTEDGWAFARRDGGYPGWRFVTNHARVLETVARDPTVRLRDVALIVGVTERTAAQIVDDLVRAGYLSKTRDGRRNRYDVHGELPLRHPHHQHRTVGDLLRFLEAPPGGNPA
ncbi:MAG TPA: helix-turn-helix domain-containing protein [Solirubrobacteraceae bacterium]|nr:helix-turn-helix domain-containing protein [Solirubrobacteraceae bacterium]